MSHLIFTLEWHYCRICLLLQQCSTITREGAWKCPASISWQTPSSGKHVTRKDSTRTIDDANDACIKSRHHQKTTHLLVQNKAKSETSHMEARSWRRTMMMNPQKMELSFCQVVFQRLSRGVRWNQKIPWTYFDKYEVEDTNERQTNSLRFRMWTSYAWSVDKWRNSRKDMISLTSQITNWLLRVDHWRMEYYNSAEYLDKVIRKITLWWLTPQQWQRLMPR